MSDDASQPRDAPSPRQEFRVLTRTRGGYDGAVMYDVQLQVAATGALLWAQTFSDEAQYIEFRDTIEADIDVMGAAEFRRKYGVPASA